MHVSSRTAICRGAVLKGFESHCKLGGRVTSTIARASLGIVVCPQFVEGKHLHKDKRWCKKELEYKADNQMCWFLKRVGTVWAPHRRSLVH